MSVIDAILLGLVQGLTEFLPISSSGHLVLAKKLLHANMAANGLTFEILLHLATLLAVFVYFRSRIFEMIRSLYTPEMREARKLIWLVILGTIPAVIIGFSFKDRIEMINALPTAVAALLIVNGLVLLSTNWIRLRMESVGPRSALIIGIAQSIAILPGISRSGSTISAGMWAGVKPERAAEYSFLLAIPAILGAAVLDIKNLESIQSEAFLAYGLGMLAAFVSGLAAIGWLMRLIRGGKFLYFGVYCIAVGLISLVVLLT